MRTQEDILIQLQETPNPSSWKFILNKTVISEGNQTFIQKEECRNFPLAHSLLELKGVKQIYFFQNVITVTLDKDFLIEDLAPQINSVIQTRMPIHDPQGFEIQDTKKAKSSKKLSPKLQKIDEILNRTVRYGLQADGGDIELIKLENHRLYIRYEGACHSCPTAFTGTLMAIESILQDEFDPELEVIPIDE